MSWRIAALAPLLVAVVALVFFVPALTREREVFVATPQPPPLFQSAPVNLPIGPPGACTGPLRIDESTDIARLRARPYPDAVRAVLVVSATAPGYTARKVFSDYADDAALDLPLPDPTRPIDNARLCVVDGGPSAGRVQGSTEPRTFGRLTTTNSGKPYDVNLVVTLLASHPASVASRLGDVLRHASAYAPGFARPGLLGALAVLVGLGAPFGAFVALRRAPVDQA